MTNDLAQVSLREPEQTDWVNYNSGGSSYAPPPPALDQNGKAITYFGTAEATETQPDQGYLNFLLDPVTINRGEYTGTTLRFTRASVKPFQKNGENIKGNPNKLANFLRATGLAVKPQTNEDYRAAVKATKNRPFGFTIDWSGYNKDTGEKIQGYLSFPEDPQRPGTRKSILRKGDTYYEVDRQGNVLATKTVESEIIFANAQLRFFQDPTRGAK
jgi:hypothetical protein